MATDRHVTEDYRCMECGGRVGTTSRHCMHCQTDLVATEGSRDTATVEYGTDHGFGSSRTGASTDDSRVGISTGGTRVDPSMGVQVGTAAVGVGTGVLLGLGVLVATLVPLGGWALPAAVVAWIGGTVLVAREDSFKHAAGTAALLLAVPALVLPLGLPVPELAGQLLAGQFLAAAETVAVGLVAASVFAPLWGLFVVVGWLLRRG